MIGIDLGTTNSVIAVWRDNKSHVIPDQGGRNLTPSVVSVDADGSILVGVAAKERLLTHPDVTVAAFKRKMGTRQEATLAKGAQFRVEELSALVLRKLLADAAAYLGQPVTECVVSVPAYFNDTQRKATLAATGLAGVKATLINEPTAAAIAYGIHDRRDQQKICVVDLGGGTLDVSILEFFDGVMEVHATAGDNWLGGEDFDSVVTQWFLQEHGLKDTSLSSIERGILKAQAVRAKHQLSTVQEATLALTVSGFVRASEYSSVLTRSRLESLCAPLLDRLRATLERALKDARLLPNTLDDVILVGGATRMPMIRNLVGRLFGRLPLSHLNPDEVVGMGAAIQSALRQNDASLSDFVLTDVCPFTLGVEIAVERAANRHESGHFLPLIERNSPIPTSRVENIVPIIRGQDTITCRIFQGESRLVQNNIELGSIDIRLPRQGGERGVNVRFTYDVDGLLEVDTEVVETGKRKSLIINNSGKTLTDEEIQARFRRLEALKIHPRDQSENRALLARAERLFEELLGIERDLVAQAARDFEAVLERQDPGAADDARPDFSRLLDQYDRDIFNRD